MKPRDLLIEVDNRGRISLGRLAGENDRFLGEVDDEGVVTLTPAIVVPKTKPIQARRPGVATGTKRSAE